MLDPVLPTLSLSSTAKETLVEDRVAVLDALREAKTRLVVTAPHARDYPNHRDYQLAIGQYNVRVAKLNELYDNIEKETIGIQDL